MFVVGSQLRRARNLDIISHDHNSRTLETSLAKRTIMQFMRDPPITRTAEIGAKQFGDRSKGTRFKQYCCLWKMLICVLTFIWGMRDFRILKCLFVHRIWGKMLPGNLANIEMDVEMGTFCGNTSMRSRSRREWPCRILFPNLGLRGGGQAIRYNYR